MRLLAFILLLALCSLAQSAAPVVSVTPSRTSGVAPLCVQFDATATTDDSTSRPFHELDYGWTFGDASAGIFSFGSNLSRSKNYMSGPIAAHCWETAGTKTWRVIVADSTGAVSSSSGSITVTDPDGVFSGALTICISAAGTFTECPAGATHITSSNFVTAISTYCVAGNRILFNRGETWLNTSAATCAASGGPGIIGAYGTGAAPKIKKNAGDTGSNFLNLSSCTTPTMSDWRIMDLEFDGSSLGNAQAEGIFGMGGVDQLTLLRMNIHDTYEAVNFSIGFPDACNAGGHPGHTIWDQMAIVDSQCATMSGNGGTCAFLGGTKLSYMGNSADDTSTSTGSHNVRIYYTDKAVISNNTLNKPGAGKHNIKLHGSCWAQLPGGCTVNTNSLIYGLYTQNWIIGENRIIAATGVDPIVAVGPQDSLSDERVRKGLIERNWITTTAGSTVGVEMWARDIDARNNIVDLSNGGTGRKFFASETRGIEPAPDTINIYNNTCRASDAFSAGFIVDLASGGAHDNTATNVSVRNNLCWTPSVTTAGDIRGTGAAPTVVSSNNSSVAQIKSTDPQFDGPFTEPKGYRPGTGSYAASAGVDLFPSGHKDLLHCDDITANEHTGALVPRVRARCTSAARQ